MSDSDIEPVALLDFAIQSVEEGLKTSDPECFCEADCAIRIAKRLLKEQGDDWRLMILVLLGLGDGCFTRIFKTVARSERDQSIKHALSQLVELRETFERSPDESG